MNLKGKRVLVTGAGGFIGSHLTERLCDVGAKVRAFVRYNSRSDLGLLRFLPKGVLSDIEIHVGDLKDGESVRRAVRNVDVVFHLGALIAIPYSYQAPLDFVQTNVLGTTNVLNAALDSSVELLVHTSTSEVYGTAQYVPIDEGHPLRAQSPYAASKIAADKLVESYYRSFGLRTAIVRPFNAFGERQSARAVIPTIISQGLAGDEIKLGALHTSRDLTYVGETVEGFLRIATCPAAVGEVVNVGSGSEIAIEQLVRRIGALLGRELKVMSEPDRMRPGMSEVERLVASTTKISQLLSWRPSSDLEAGLRRTIEWIAAHAERYRTDEYVI